MENITIEDIDKLITDYGYTEEEIKRQIEENNKKAVAELRKPVLARVCEQLGIDMAA